MSIYKLKPAFQSILRPLVRVLAKIGVTANQVTLLALLLSFLAGSLIFFFQGVSWTLFLVPAVLFVRMALNAIDGMLAREFDMKSPLGAILNELGDVFSDTALYLPLVVVPLLPSGLLVLAVILSVITEMTGVVAVQIGAERRYDGPMGKSDRAFVFGVLTLLLGFELPLEPWMVPLFVIINILLLLTIYNRSRKALSTRVQ